jgi:tetratricopeptide (TPR) repeat protein
MSLVRHLLLATCMGLAGCAGQPPAPSVAQLPWHDEAFGYAPTLVSIHSDDLFALDPEFRKLLDNSSIRQARPDRRLDRLVDLLYGPKQQRFAYGAGHSTVPTETWRRRQGDCISLTVLTYAAARALDLPAQIQEVDVPATYDRRGNLDVLNGHVNVLFPHVRGAPDDDVSIRRDVVMDFEPEFGSLRRGRFLTETAVLARFYNNLAVEHMANGHRALAYAHFKASIAADPLFAASYGNLAALYRQSAMDADAERLLRIAVGLAEPPDVALQALHQLLVEQGRATEATQIAAQLESSRKRDPYYWIELGIRAINKADFAQAVDALEHAQQMTTGFAEVHRYLALAYWRAGNVARAHEQLAMLESADGHDGGIPVLRQKFKSHAN